MSYAELAELMETVDFAMLAESFFGSSADGADGGAEGGAEGATGHGAFGPIGAIAGAETNEAFDYDALVDAASSAFEIALGDFTERTCEETHRTLELAVALLTRLDAERGAKARERTDRVNAIKNASVILCGPMIDR